MSIAALLFVIGAFYYLRIIKLMYFDAPADSGPITASKDFRILLEINALAMVAITPWVGTLMELCARAIRGMV